MSVVAGGELRGQPATAFQLSFKPATSLVQTSTVQKVVARLEALHEQFGARPPWLFRHDPVWPSAHPTERAMLQSLEARVAECDRLEAVSGDLDLPDLLQRRRSVLIDMDAAGLLTSVNQGPKLNRLLRWRLTHLAEWYEAALDAEKYISSEGRRRYMPDAETEPVLGGPVCLDLFRGGLVCPPSVDQHEWASWGEWLLSDRPRQGDQGEFLYHDLDGWVTVRWRRDDPSRPSVLGVALRPASPVSGASEGS